MLDFLISQKTGSPGMLGEKMYRVRGEGMGRREKYNRQALCFLSSVMSVLMVKVIFDEKPIYMLQPSP